jgi:hypothetical protein
MRNSQAGLRSGHPSTRFSPSPGHRGAPQLGLRRGLPTRMTAHPGQTARVPLLAALRGAARTVTPAQSSVPATSKTNVVRLRPSVSISWSQPANFGSRRPRPRSAAPWRG